jgi:hypothetical protein
MQGFDQISGKAHLAAIFIAVCRTDFRNGVKKALYKTAG